MARMLAIFAFSLCLVLLGGFRVRTKKAPKVDCTGSYDFENGDGIKFRLSFIDQDIAEVWLMGPEKSEVQLPITPGGMVVSNPKQAKGKSNAGSPGALYGEFQIVGNIFGRLTDFQAISTPFNANFEGSEFNPNEAIGKFKVIPAPDRAAVEKQACTLSITDKANSVEVPFSYSGFSRPGRIYIYAKQ